MGEELDPSPRCLGRSPLCLAISRESTRIARWRDLLLLYLLQHKDELAQPRNGLACHRNVGTQLRRQRRRGDEERCGIVSAVPVGNPAVGKQPIYEPVPEVQSGPPEAHSSKKALQGLCVRGAPPALVLGDRRSLHPRKPGKLRLGQIECASQHGEHPAKRYGCPGLPRLFHSCHVRILMPPAHRGAGERAHVYQEHTVNNELWPSKRWCPEVKKARPSVSPLDA